MPALIYSSKGNWISDRTLFNESEAVFVPAVYAQTTASSQNMDVGKVAVEPAPMLNSVFDKAFGSEVTGVFLQVALLSELELLQMQTKGYSFHLLVKCHWYSNLSAQIKEQNSGFARVESLNSGFEAQTVTQQH